MLIVGFILVKLLGGGVRGRKGSRLGISEFYEIDKTRRLVLIRRDDMEHLIIIGGEHDLVVETNIGSPLSRRKLPRRVKHHAHRSLAADAPLRPVARLRP